MVFRIAVELPFMVLLVHRRDFKTEEAALGYIRRHYRRFPALTVLPSSHIENWKGSRFQFPARGRKR